MNKNEGTTIFLEEKIERLIDELNEINKKAKCACEQNRYGDYKYLTEQYLWKFKIYKTTEERLEKLFITQKSQGASSQII